MFFNWLRCFQIRFLHSYLQAIPDQIEVNPYSNMTCGVPKSDSWVILREPVGSDMPWPGFIFGQTPASIWYWCADQVAILDISKREI